MITRLTVKTTGQGLYDFTSELNGVIRNAGIDEGLCTIMVQHTSASLVIQENADPAVQNDLVSWINRLVPEGDSHYTHTQEGPDDMPAHIKSALTTTSLSIPLANGKLALGTWQAVYLWEHRRTGSSRSMVVHISS